MAIKLNQQSCELLGVTDDDYKNWCRANKKARYKTSNKAEFLAKVRDGKLVRNDDGLFVKAK